MSWLHVEILGDPLLPTWDRRGKARRIWLHTAAIGEIDTGEKAWLGDQMVEVATIVLLNGEVLKVHYLMEYQTLPSGWETMMGREG